MSASDQVVSRQYRLKIILYAIAVGIVAGLLSIIYHTVFMHGKKLVLYLDNKYEFLVLLLPFIVYLVLFFSHKLYLGGEGDFGVSAVDKELKQIERHMMTPAKVFIKLVNTLIALSAGFAVGQLGPTVYLGGAIGSNLGYYLKLPKSVIRMLIGCGVAAALSAILRTPLFAALIVVEVVFGKRYFDYMLPVLTSGLVAYFIDSLVIGDYDFIHIGSLQKITHLTFKHWLVAVLLALGLGILSALYTKGIKIASLWLKLFKHRVVSYFLVALITALIMAVSPDILFFDSVTMPKLLTGQLTIGMLITLLILRFILTTMQLGSGVFGGNFSPGIVIGILFGVLVYTILNTWSLAPFDLAHFIAFSIVGMFAGFAHAPISAVVLAIELSGDSTALLPFLLIAIISHFVSDFLVRENAFNL